uniref:Uncharacterized protein n=1 Tax=Avena sativa TaxID=4498 RepID=A0ACD5YA64_AVESA
MCELSTSTRHVNKCIGQKKWEISNDSNINPQCNREWLSDWFVEESRAIHQDWSMPMNNQFDLNMDCNIQQEERRANDVDESIWMDNSLGDDIEYESHSSEESYLEEEIDWQKEGYTDVAELFPTPNEEELNEAPVVDKAALAREARSKAAKSKAIRTQELKMRAAAGTTDDAFVLSDSCSDDNKELIGADDDGAVLESQIATRKYKSRAKPPKKRVYYDEMKENAHEQIQLDLCFHDVTQLRRVLDDYHIAYLRNFTYLKNNQDRVIACCSSEGTCAFMIYSSQIEGENTHCIRQINLPHTCGTNTDNSRITSTWIAKKYEDMIRSDPTMNISALMDAVMREHGVEISKHMAYRAKNKAIEAIEGHEDMRYLRIRDYLQTVMDKNPGSRCHVTTIRPTNKPEKNPRFHGLFFALYAQIDGFKNGCRPFIGVDGCFLKLGNGAQVLAATARDGNNNFFPLAFGVVGTEDKASWAWFLHQLKYALGGTAGQFGSYTIMSDRQKGLIAAVHSVFPDSCHRYCLRHIYSNFMSAGHKSGDLKKLIDRASYAFDKYDFDTAMEEMKKEDKGAWEWMCKIPPKHWARHAFDTNCKTDLVVNNLSEVFNSFILKARDKPIVTMIESIRTKLMPRFATKKEGVEHVQWEITPTYVERLEWEKRNARWCTNIVRSKQNLWQVTHIERTYEVNLAERKCGCFKWDLTGIPCKHAVEAIHKAREFPEDYVSDFFKKPMYREAYKNAIYPVPGQHGWTKTNSPDIDPPEYKTKRGRKQKKRRKGKHESTKSTVQNRMTTIKCSNCKLQGHRYTNCTTPLKPHLAARKTQHKTVRRLPDAAPPPAPQRIPLAPQRNAAPAPSPLRHASPPTAPRRNASSAPWYEGTRTYSYFTAGLGYQQNSQQG